LTVGYNDFVVRHLAVNRAVKRFKAGCPRAELTLPPMWSVNQIRDLKAGTIDLAMMQRMDESSTGLKSREMFSQNMLLALPRDHKLTRKPELFMPDLKDQKLILPKRKQAPLLVDYIFSALHANGVHPRNKSEIVNAETLLLLVSAGMGIGFVNEAGYRRFPGIRLRSVADFNYRARIDIVHREDSRSVLLKNFVSVLGEELGAC